MYSLRLVFVEEKDLGFSSNAQLFNSDIKNNHGNVRYETGNTGDIHEREKKK